MSIIKKSKPMLFPRLGKTALIISVVVLSLAAFRAYQIYRYIFEPTISADFVLYIPANSTFEQVTDSLTTHKVLGSLKAFQWVAKHKDYPKIVKTGRYLLKKGSNTNTVVNMLKGGLQTPLNVTFNNVRTEEELAGKVGKYLQTDSLSILNLFANTQLIDSFGFTPVTFKTMFLPNTYEFYWTTTAKEFALRMKKEYDRFWNTERRTKAEELKLSLPEVSTLASIVQAETAKKDEQKRIAGLYINRLQRGQLLQADPTVKYAVGDFSLKRILNVHLQTDSPYNTYLHAGLPPGPINFPETTTIDAVLNYEKHNYLYMCAKEDFSGYHNFAVTLNEHNRNAAKYRAALNRNKIW